MRLLGCLMLSAGTVMFAPVLAWAQQGQFQIEEATIPDIHNAIRSGQTTCQQVVEAYLERTKAFNGACTALVTKDGAPIPPSTGMVRAGSPLEYPTQTVAASTIFPNFEQYAGPPLELGRMEPSISDPSVQLQFGLRAGIPDAGQLNALETLNIRGERSITCKGDFDRAPSAGPLPEGAPKACEEFRKLPDALERAAELDRQYGRNPNLTEMPMYCVVFSFKNWFDSKDMRGTGGYDVNYAMDVPKADSPDIAELRRKGAIIFAVATANAVGGPTRGAGPNKATAVTPDNNLQYSLWGGQACNPYDTARVPRGTSNGSGVSVAANLVTCSLCQQGFASCKGPASRNNVVNILTTKGVIMDGGITSRAAGSREGIHCRSVSDAVLVLDAIKGFETEDMFTALPKGTIPAEPYASFVVPDSAVPAKPLKGVRVGIVREFMVKHTKNDTVISDQLDKEIKAVLRDKLGAELVESVDPLYADDASVPNMKYTFADAFAEVLPHNAPEYFWQKVSGELEFAVPGWDVRTVDYAVALSLGKAPLSPKINVRRISAGLANPSSPYSVNRYLTERGDERVKDWASYVANAKFKTEAELAGAMNNIADQDPRANPDGISFLKMQSVLRMVILKVMHENDIDVFVNPEQTTPPYLLGGAPEPEVNNRPSLSCCGGFTPLAGAPEIEVPAGYVTTTFDPKYALSSDKKHYYPVTGDVETKLPYPMPLSLMFWAGPGSDSDVIKVASAYEAATHHRVPPANFGPLPAPTQTSSR
jgi:Asp-tRNA(Asn)/Glu-tRNA(Gln) amidotransferase A subunit family amidase